MNTTDEKKILVTGASRGIGEAIARHFSKLGFFVILVARTEIDLARVKREIILSGGKADYIVSDLSSEEESLNLSQKLSKSYGFVEYIVLNAGISTNCDFLSQTTVNFQKELWVNYLAPLLFLKNILEGMVEQKRGKIVTIASIAGLLPFPGNSTYAASKAALISLSITMNIELKKHNIYIGSVLPGLTKTSMTKDYESFVLPFSEPEEIARCVEEAFQQEKTIVIPGVFNNLITTLYKHFPEPLNILLSTLTSIFIPTPINKN